MVEVPGVATIANEIRARIRQIEKQLKQYRDLSDELERLRGALERLEGGVRSRVPGLRSSPPSAAARARKPASKPATPRRAAGAKKPRRASSPAARGQTRAKILEALKDGPMTAGDIAKATGIGRGSASTTLTKLAKTGEVVKAQRGYRLPG
jgi:DNA-binding transcriptional ArsR family regulator